MSWLPSWLRTAGDACSMGALQNLIKPVRVSVRVCMYVTSMDACIWTVSMQQTPDPTNLRYRTTDIYLPDGHGTLCS